MTIFFEKFSIVLIYSLIQYSYRKREIINKYYEFFLQYKTKNNKKLAQWTLNVYMQRIKSFFNFLVKKGHLLFNPMKNIKLHKVDRSITKKTMNEYQIKKILSIIDTTTATGLRDRAIIELLFSTGIKKRSSKP